MSRNGNQLISYAVLFLNKAALLNPVVQLYEDKADCFVDITTTDDELEKKLKEELNNSAKGIEVLEQSPLRVRVWVSPGELYNLSSIPGFPSVEIKKKSSSLHFLPDKNLMSLLYDAGELVILHWDVFTDTENTQALAELLDEYYEIILIGDENTQFSLVDLNEFPHTLRVDDSVIERIKSLRALFEQEVFSFGEFLLNTILVLKNSIFGFYSKGDLAHGYQTR